jgi:hypothetical protein
MRVTVALVIAAWALAASPPPASAGSAKGWCAYVINVNTKYGLMENKRYLPKSRVPQTAWKHVVNAILAGRDRYIALAPTSIKTAVKHEITWYVEVKSNHYSRATRPAPLTHADITRLTVFQNTRCGITFAGDWPLPPS